MVVTPITSDKKPKNIMKKGRKKRDNRLILVNQVFHVVEVMIGGLWREREMCDCGCKPCELFELL